MPRALLIGLRDEADPMLRHEALCFRERAGLSEAELAVHAMPSGRPSRWKLRRYDALFFGGSGAYSIFDDVAWIQRSLDLLVDVVELKIPSWASCFGFQGLAMALGGTVEHDESRTEMGSTWLELTEAGHADPLLGTLPSGFWAQEGHQDSVTAVPEGVTMLATGSLVEAQAFRVDGAPFWASQFHPELTVQRTLDRFRHYRNHYAAAEADGVLKRLEEGEETREVGELLARLVRLPR